MRLGIGIASNRDWKPAFGISLVHLVNYLTRKGVKGRNLERVGLYPMVQCSLLQKGRRLVLENAIKDNCTHILCADDDMAFPDETLDYFCRSDAAMIAANYQSRSFANEGTAISLAGGRVSSKDKSGQEEVDRAGFGLTLLDLSVVQNMPHPWFAVPWLPDEHTELGEDYYFCVALRKAGHRIVVDHDVSNSVRHIGETALVTP